MADVRVEWCGFDCEEVEVEQGEHYIDEDLTVYVVNEHDELVDIASGDTWDVDDLCGLRKLDDTWCIHVHKEGESDCEY